MDQTQTPRYVSRIAPLLYVPVFTQKDFHYMSTQDLLQREALLRNYNSTLGVHNSSLKYNYLYTRGIGTRLKQRKDYNLGDPMTTNNTW